MAGDLIALRNALENNILARTGRRVRNLAIILSAEEVTLQGRATSFYDKQMAQCGVRDLLPEIPLRNAIEVA